MPDLVALLFFFAIQGLVYENEVCIMYTLGLREGRLRLIIIITAFIVGFFLFFIIKIFLLFNELLELGRGAKNKVVYR
jgi:hypothetical protein